MRRLDLRLYLVTDPHLVPAHALVDTVMAAVRGGVTCVQLRDKAADTRPLLEAARALVARLAPLGVPLIVNDRADVALAAGADGVHVGQSDLPIEDARRLLGPERIVGVSIEALEQADGAAGADYLAASPVYATPTKTDTAPPLGLEGVRALVERGPVPVVGIGGIGAAEAAAVMEAGAAGIAVVSAILGAPDVEAAAEQLRAAVDRGDSRRRGGGSS